MPKHNRSSHRIPFFACMVLLFLMSLLKGKGGYGADVVTSCPEYFVDGQVNIITCTVNQTSISNTACAFPPYEVSLQLVSAAGTVQDTCSSAYPTTSCALQTTAKTCFCASLSGDTLTYQWNFLADKARQGGNFSCNICDFFTGAGPLRAISPNCSRIQFETTTAATTTAAAASTTAAAASTTAAAAAASTTATAATTAAAPTERAYWIIIISVILPTLFIITVIIVACKWKRLLCFENKTVDPTRTSNECHQNDLRSGKPDASSASAPPDQSSLIKSKTTNSEKTGSHHVASEKSPPKEHSTRKETALDLTELNSGSATSEESASNIVTHRQLRPLPTPNLTSVERNSSVDPFRQTNPLPEISARLKQ